jgi:hypothetical protein
MPCAPTTGENPGALPDFQEEKNMKYLENLAMDTSRFAETKNGMSYLSWPVAVALAGRPEHALVQFGSNPYLEVFGGAVVAVDMGNQRTWLPVLNDQNKPVPVANITSRDVSDTYQRCRTKAIATTYGIGMSFYAGFDGNGRKFVEELGITDGTDLSTAKAITSKKPGSNAQYLDWASALAAARATDPEFHWEVGMYQDMDRQTGEMMEMPYMRVRDTFMVSITVAYKGARHTEWLPIMGVLPVKTKYGEKKMDHQPLMNPNVFDWNRSVMRCLAKAISVVSGYGLSIYAGEDLCSGTGGGAAAAADLTEIRSLLKQAGKDEAAMCTWLGVESLEEADQESIIKAENVLRKWLGKQQPAVEKAVEKDVVSVPA